MLFVMVCINSFAKDYLRSSSSSFILSGWYICSNSLGICYLSLELTDYFTHPLNSRSFLLYSQMWELNYPATRKMFCDLSRPKIVSYICNKSKNIVFVSQIKLWFRGLNYFNHSFLNYSISSCGVSSRGTSTYRLFLMKKTFHICPSLCSLRTLYLPHHCTEHFTITPHNWLFDGRILFIHRAPVTSIAPDT